MNPYRTRPVGIILLALNFLCIGCMGTLILPIMILAGMGRLIWESLSPAIIHAKPLGLAVTVLGLMLLLGGYVLYASIGVGLWKLRPWALKGAKILHVVGIAGGLIAALVALKYQPLLAIPLAIGLVTPFAAILWYLKRPNIEFAFDPRAVPAQTSALLQTAPLKPRGGKLWIKVTVGISICVLLIASFVVSLLYAVETSFRKSDVYRLALEQSQKSPCVVAELGSPILAKGSIEGNLSESSVVGSADLEIPIRGSRAEGNLQVAATKTDGHWKIDSLTLLDAEGQTQLLPAPSPCR